MGAKVPIPVNQQSQRSAFDCAGWRRVSNNIPSIAAVRRLCREGEGGHSSPSPDYDQQERCSNQPRDEYRIRKYAGTISNAVEGVFALCTSSQGHNAAPSQSFIPTCPSPASRQSKHWSTVRQLAGARPFSLPSSSPCQFCPSLPTAAEFFGVFLSLSVHTRHSTARACPLLGSEWIMTVSASISAESAGCRGISSAAYRGTAARSYRCHLESSPGAAVAGLICHGFLFCLCR